MIRVSTAGEVMVVKREALNALAVSTGIDKDEGSSDDMTFIGLNDKADGSSNAKARLSRGFAEPEDKNAIKEAVAHCVRAERNV